MSTSKFIALLNHDSSLVEAVFPNQASAMESLGLKSSGAISTALKNGTKCQGRRVKKWDDLDDSSRSAFLKSNNLPEAKLSAKAKGVVRMNLDRTVIKTYARITDVVKDVGVARESVAVSCDNGSVFKDSLWAWS
jgi:hypothetical protein